MQEINREVCIYARKSTDTKLHNSQTAIPFKIFHLVAMYAAQFFLHAKYDTVGKICNLLSNFLFVSMGTY